MAIRMAARSSGLARERARGAGRPALPERERHRHADEEEEEGEDRVGIRPAVPLRVAQRRVNGRPGSRVVHDDHARDRRSPHRVDGVEAAHRWGYCNRVRALAFFLLLGPTQGFVTELTARQRQGPYEVTLLLPPSGLYAQEEMEIEFRVVEPDATGPDGGRKPMRGHGSMPRSRCRACRRWRSSRRSRTARRSPASSACTRSFLTAATTGSA